MTTLHLAQLTLLAIAACIGVAVAGRRPGHWPVPAYLLAVGGLDLLRVGLGELLEGAPIPREGWQLAARHLDQAAYLALVLSLPALGLAAFCGAKSRWAIAGAWAALCAVVVAGYPELAGRRLMGLYWALELAGAILTVGLYLHRRPPPSCTVRCVLLATAASLATTVHSGLVGARLLDPERWQVLVGLWAVAFGAVAVLQLAELKKA